ncbi:hypothetical protein A2U01_0076919, partial [Trifolium medium]|nr:hypothetical protein [Trifolium medium]
MSLSQAMPTVSKAAVI